MVRRPAKKPAHGAPKALRNYGKPKIPVFLMGGEDCIVGTTVGRCGHYCDYCDYCWVMGTLL